jgi:hypothetical protein
MSKVQTIRMNIHVTGTRNGVEWPYIGGTIDLPYGEAIQLAAAGYGTLVGDAREEHPSSDAAPETIETATITTERKTRKTKRG